MLRMPEGDAPELGPRPYGGEWHLKTLDAWREFFESPMASEWMPTDITGLRMVAVLYDEFYKTADIEYMKEIRLQRPCYGLTPLDRSRLQWEFKRGEDAERGRKVPDVAKATRTKDPRSVLRMATAG